jgi:hypothetical protein
VRRMAAEGIHDQLSLGAEFPRTLAALLFRPGLLTREYLAGRIMRYVPPLRLYLVASLAFFFILSWSVDLEESLAGARADAVAAADSAAAGPATGSDGGFQMEIEGEGPIDIGIQFDTTGTGPLAPAKRWTQHRVDRLKAMDRDELARRFLEGFQRNAPRAVFTLLPIYALVLKLLYLRRTRLYAEHFVFALHIHAFAFVLFTLMFVTPDWMDTAILMGWIPVYIFLAMLRVYGQSVPKTLLKYGVLVCAYCTILLFLLAATAVVTVLTI